MNGFHSLYYSGICDQDGRNWKCTSPIQFVAKDGTGYQIPIGAPTDGASIPAIFWTKLPPFGKYWLAAVLHDAAYNGTLELLDGTKANLTKAQCDDLLKEAMEASGVDPVTVEAIYEAVHLFGGPSFKGDR